MAEHEEGQKLEKLLDSMLAAYSAAEPRPGLETRILANLRALGDQNERHWWRPLWFWAGTGAAAAVASVLLAIVFFRAGRPPDPAPNQANRTGAQTEIASQHVVSSRHANVGAATTKGSRTLAAGGQKMYRQNLPMQTAASWPAMFPTPVPLAEQEKLMFAYVESTPREEVIAQLVRDEQKEIDAFWEDRAPSSGAQRSGNTR